MVFYIIEFSRSTNPLVHLNTSGQLSKYWFCPTACSSLQAPVLFVQDVSLCKPPPFFRLQSCISLVLNLPLDYTARPLGCQGQLDYSAVGSLCGVIQLSCRTRNVLLRGILLYCLSKLGLTSVILQYAPLLFLYLSGLHVTQNQYRGSSVLKNMCEMFKRFSVNSNKVMNHFSACAPRSIFNSRGSVLKTLNNF